jgi:hypothetical protein
MPGDTDGGVPDDTEAVVTIATTPAAPASEALSAGPGLPLRQRNEIREVPATGLGEPSAARPEVSTRSGVGLPGS